jgi:hypothetical protein
MKRILLTTSLIAFFAICFAQNVGIGTNTPAAKLEVKSASNYVLQLNGAAPMYSGLFENDVYRGYFGSYSGAAEDVDFGTGAGNTTGKLHLTIQSVPKLTVDAMGNVGIGTMAPEYSLHVRTTSGEASAGIQAAGTASQALLNLSIDNRSDGNALLLLKYRGSVAGTFAGIPRANLSVIAADAGAGGLLISTNQASPVYFATNVTERMRITDNGSVGIGVKNPTGILEVDAGPASETSIRLKNAADIGIRQWFMMGNDLSSALVIARFGTFFGGTLLGQSNQNLSAIYTNDLGVNALAIGTKNNIPLVLGTGNAERLRISGGGSVGVGLDPSSFVQLHVKRPGAAGLAPGTEWGAIYGENGNANAGYGVFGYSQAPRLGAQGYAGVTGYNDNTGIERYGVIGMSNGSSSAPAYSAGVAGYGDYGVLGWSASNTGAGIIAQHANGRTALELNNGFLKVSGTNRTAFTVTASAGNSSGHILTLTYANPAPTDILLVTHNYNPGGGLGGTLHDYNVGVFWNGSAWAIYNENTTIPILGKSFNVLVVKQ